MSYTFEPIGIIHSCFKEKFGIPRQPGLVRAAEGILELTPPYNQPNALQGVEGYSHLWISFIFHQSMNTPWRPMVRPPRLGGNKKIGVFATRSPIRPNPIGLSVVEVASIEANKCLIHLKGLDLLDGTPVIDIKPYVPYVDSVPKAKGGFAHYAPPQLRIEVIIEEQAERALAKIVGDQFTQTIQLIKQLLELDPRPAYIEKNKTRNEFGMRLNDFNIRWRMEGETATLFEITKAKE